MLNEFSESLKRFQPEFGLELSDEKIEILTHYYDLILEHNQILHLVAPSSTEEFVIRHVLESLTLLEFLPINVTFADIGPGAGLPSVPCLIARNDLKCVLIESKIKKAKFLEKALRSFGFEDRMEIVNRQFEEVNRPPVSHVTCRALDKFAKKIPQLMSWKGESKFLFFGGNNLAEAFEQLNIRFEQKLMPKSEKRFLFIGLT